MNNLILNIGLNTRDGNVELNSQLSNTLHLLTKNSFWWIKDLKVVKGEYQGIAERTLVVALECSVSLHFIENLLSSIAVALDQVCIAYTYNGMGYITNDVVEFNSDYFISI
jgi:hypothetical protein